MVNILRLLLGFSPVFSSAPWAPNAERQAPPEAGAERSEA
jgi:hypothetical protein